jgi:hypothetical protein
MCQGHTDSEHTGSAPDGSTICRTFGDVRPGVAPRLRVRLAGPLPIGVPVLSRQCLMTPGEERQPLQPAISHEARNVLGCIRAVRGSTLVREIGLILTPMLCGTVLPGGVDFADHAPIPKAVGLGLAARCSPNEKGLAALCPPTKFSGQSVSEPPDTLRGLRAPCAPK